MRLVYSVRTAEDVIYADELGDDAVLTFTREPPDGLGTATPAGSTRELIAEAGIDSRHRLRLRLERLRRGGRPAAARRRASSPSGSGPSASGRPAERPSSAAT